jgi:hypothetical protein
MNVFWFLMVFLVLDILINIFTRKVVKFLGLDFLFIGSWLAGVKYGFVPGVIVALVLLFEHSAIMLKKTRYIFPSLPVQILAVFLGYHFGFDYFVFSLLIYQATNSLLMLLIKAFGPRFVVFVILNTVFNIFIFRAVSILL